MSTEPENVDTDSNFAAFEAQATAPEKTDPPADEPKVEDAPEKDDTLELTEGDELVKDEGDDEEGKRQRSKPLRQRLGEVSEKKRLAEQERDYWKGVAEGRIKPGEPEVETKAVDFTEAEPDPNDEKYEYGEADPQYLRDLARYEGRKAFAEAQAEAKEAERKTQAEAVSTELNNKWNEKAAQGAAKYADFNEVVLESAAAGEWPCPPLVAAAISQSDVGADVAYHLASNPDQATAIATGLATDPLGAAREFGAIEGRFMDAPPTAPASNHPLDVAIFAGRLSAFINRAPKTEAAPVKTTQAPEPPGHRVRGASGQFEAPADTTDFAAFERKALGKR